MSDETILQDEELEQAHEDALEVEQDVEHVLKQEIAHADDSDDDDDDDDHEDAQDDEHEEDDEDSAELQPLPTEKVGRILQAALLATAEPLTVKRLLKLFKRPKPEVELLKSLLKEIQEDYEDHDVLRLINTASGYQFQVADELSPWLLRLWEQKPPRYSRALLETLALVAYKQPITRGEIESVRGVSVSNHIIKTLLDRGWINVVGQREVPGRPSLYGTTKAFLDYFNLKKLSDLPDLPELQGLIEEKQGVPEEDEPIQVELPLVDIEEEDDELVDEEIVDDEIVAEENIETQINDEENIETEIVDDEIIEEEAVDEEATEIDMQALEAELVEEVRHEIEEEQQEYEEEMRESELETEDCL